MTFTTNLFQTRWVENQPTVVRRDRGIAFRSSRGNGLGTLSPLGRSPRGTSPRGTSPLSPSPCGTIRRRNSDGHRDEQPADVRDRGAPVSYTHLRAHETD